MTPRMRNYALSFVLLSLAGCAPERPSAIRIAASWDDATDIDARQRDEIDQAFADALCYCTNLLGVTGTTVPDEVAHDPVLSDMAPSPTCSLSAASLRGALPGPAERIGGTSNAEAIIVNACVNTVPSAPGGGGLSIASARIGGVTRGFCEAELNHCIGNELRLKAASLARAPSSVEVRDWIHTAARERFFISALQYSGSLSFYGAFCGTSAIVYGSQSHECDRLTTHAEFGHVMTSRMADAASQAIELAELESRSAMARSDALAHTETLGESDYLTRVWGVGPGGPGLRLQAATRIYGRADESLFASSAPSSVFEPWDRGEIDQPVASRLHRDRHANLALALMVRYRVPLAHTTVGDVSQPDLAAFAGTAEALFQLLDHRMAAQAYLAPYGPPIDQGPGVALRQMQPTTLAAATVLPPLVTSPLARLGLSAADVENALALAHDQLTTLSLTYEPIHQVSFPHGGTTAWLDALDIRAMQQRDPRLLASALGLEGPPDSGRSDPYPERLPLHPAGLTADDVDLRIFYPREDVIHPTERNYYSFDAGRLSRSGAADAAQVLRVHLLRLIQGHENRFADVDVVQSAVQMLDGALGSYWTEWNRQHVDSCAGLLCMTRLPPADRWFAPTATGRWDLWYDPAAPANSRFATGEPVMVRTHAGARCLLAGRTDCTEEVVDLGGPCPPSTGAPLTDAWRLNRTRCQYTIALPTTWDYPTSSPADSRAYVFWRRDIDPTSTGTRWLYELLDVVHPRVSNEVHAHGGRFGDITRDVLARDPLNPGRPAISSHGFSYDFVPPLENELTDDGDDAEDSWQRYLDDAELAQVRASSLLDAARSAEEEMILDRIADSVQIDAAAIAQREVVGEICGSLGSDEGCSFERTTPVTLGELGLVPSPVIGPEWLTIPSDPTSPPRGPRYAGSSVDASCEEVTIDFLIANFEPGGTASDWPGYVDSYFGRALTCSYWRLLRGAESVVVRDLPARVRDELRVRGDGNFADVDGAVRDEYVALYGELLAIESALQQIHNAYALAMGQVDRRATDIAATLGSNDSGLCHFGMVLGAVIAVVAAIVVSVVSWGTAAAAAIAASAAAITGVVAGWEHCFDHINQAASETNSALVEVAASFAQLESEIYTARGAVLAVARTDSRLDRMERRLLIAAARRDIAVRATEVDALADMPEWHALQDVRLRRARGAVERARVASWIARRALEYRFASEFSLMSTPERFTPAPASWVNDVFLVDTAAEGASWPRGAYVNVTAEALEDHVRLLRDFTRGYAFRHPFVEGTDLAVLDLAMLGGVVSEEAQTAAFATGLMFKCPGDPTLRPMTGSVAPCSGPEWAEMSFELSPHRGTYLRGRLARDNYNYRHEALTINIVGTGVTDCSRAERPADCYGDGNLQYVLEHDGEVLLENHEGQLFTFFADPGVIRGARALAAERMLTTPLSSADGPQVARFSRQELRGRPVEGRYRLRILGRPEIVWENIDGVQLALQYRYWTRQR